MRFIADFHIHSKYSRATSADMDLEHIAKSAKIKGIKVVGTSDFTHPEWLKNLKEKLEPAEPGLFKLKKGFLPAVLDAEDEGVRFILTSEISCIYSKNNRVHKVHILIFAPNFNVVENINARLGWVGNLKADGRPILGMDAKELTKIALGASEKCLVVPAHIYTPWFSLFGSKSGFDSIEECFEEYSKYIYAGETGLSSDPSASWRNSSLDRIALISCSDAHSPQKLGREACVFDTELSYPAIIEAIKQKDPQKFLYTIEFFPEEGKYHYDGHRNCNVVLAPEETKKYNGLCPVCGRPLTVGVLYRVEELADRPEGYRPQNAVPYKSLIPLGEVIAESLGVGVATKQVEEHYKEMIKEFGSELDILLGVPESNLKSSSLPEITEAILRVRDGRVHIEPGYDGVYGKIRIFSEGEKRDISGQKSLF